MRKYPFHLMAVAMAAVSAYSASYYVDPATGSMSNAGTSGSPWSTLEAVFSAGKTFSAGDVIYLRDGFHGSPTVAGHNSGDVTIQPQSGHEPELRKLSVNNASRWVITGLSISPAHASVYDNSDVVDITASCNYITLQDCEVSFAFSISGWTTTNMTSRLGTGIRTRAPNTTLLNNQVVNTRYGIVVVQTATNSVVRENVIQGIMEDGIRLLADYCTYEYNTITDFYGVNTAHDDGMQSWSTSGTVYGVVIRGNLIINQTTTTNPFPDTYGVQGMGFFDGWYEDWVIENNVVVTDMWHGISLYGAKDCKVVNNTVVQTPVHPLNRVPWMAIYNHKNGQASTGNVFRNNMASDIGTLAGTTSGNNIESTAYTTHFVDYANFDLRLLSGSSAVDAGTTTDAPSIDFDQNTRSSPYDIGAFEYNSGADTEAPTVPTGLADSNETSTTVDLDWNASTDNVGVDGYYIYTDGANPVSVGTNSATVAGLSPSTSYTFTVSAYDAALNESAQSSGVNVTTLAGATIEEDFSSSAANFTVESGGSWNVSGGRYVLTSPASSGTPGVLGNISVHDTVLSGDFQLSALLRITGTGSVWDDAVIVFGYQDEDNYYYVSLNESNDGNTKGLLKVVNGVPTELADISLTVTANTDYTVEIERSGNSIDVWVNSSQVASVTDSTFTSGKAGFGSYNDGAQFDNLTVFGGEGEEEPTILFSDDFNDGNANGWTTSGGSWSVNSNQYLNTGSGWSYAGDTSWTDYYVEAEVRVDASTWACVHGRFLNVNNAYHLEIHVGNQELAIWKRVSGTWTKLSSYSTSISTGVWYTLKLEMEGSSLKGYLNGVERIAITDTSLTAGGIAVRSGNTARFDNIEVGTHN